MNNFNNFFSGFKENGQPRGPDYTPAQYRKAFARIYVILHGGAPGTVDAKLQRLGLPPVQGDEPLANPFPLLRVVWSPLAVDLPTIAANAANVYFPGSPYVDVFGGDIYVATPGGGSTAWKGMQALYTSGRNHGKPFSVPEWGLTGVDDPGFVQDMCDFLKSHAATESALFYESKPGSRWDLGVKPNSRARYRSCITPLAGPFPAWAAANEPGGGARVIALKLTPRPAAGTAPHTVTFSIAAKLGVPIQQWLLVYDDGTEDGGSGPPPATVQHTYDNDGVYPATLIVFPFPPFTTANASYYTSADVTVGSGAGPVISFTPTPDSGPVPLSVSFRAELDLTGPVTSWEMVFGDGETRQGTGPPPHFSGHTFKSGGNYDVLLIVRQSGGRQFISLTPISAGGGGSLPPPKATKTGTVLVNGKAFTGGTIPFNSTVDVTKGTITLTTSKGKMKLYGESGVTAIFVLQKGTDKGKPIMVLKLAGGNFKACPKRTTSSVSSSTAKKKPIRSLWGDGKGSFQTKGRFASATVRGTKWLTSDLCEGTLTQVQRGVVEVKDVKLKKTVRVPAGKSYLAKG